MLTRTAPPVGGARVALGLALALALALAWPAGALAQAIDAELEALSERWTELFNAGDFDALAELYTEDTRWINADGIVFDGRDGVRGYARAIFEAGFEQVEIGYGDGAADGALAYASGTYLFTHESGTTLPGYFLTVLVHDGEAWRILRHMASNEPPPE
jgi:uncharacterized protein (TIGR02246 family)